VADVEALCAGIDLGERPLRAVLLSPPGGPVRLLLAAHPMVLDSRSFHLLVEDLAAACEAIRHLPPHSPLSAMASFRSLAMATRSRTVPVAPEARTAAAAATLWAELGRRETRELLDEVLGAYGNTVEEVLVAAFTAAYVGWTGARELVMELEGTLPEGGSEGRDASRTIGCLASPCPVHLEGKADPGDLLKGVKESLRQLPRWGREVALPVPEVGLRWWGELVAADWRGERLLPRRDPGALRRRLLDVEGTVSGGCLRVAWTFSEQVYRRDAIQALADRFLQSLRSLIRHCQSAEAGGFSPSDFPAAGLSQEDLDDLLAELS
jgi:hypothetical protein